MSFETQLCGELERGHNGQPPSSNGVGESAAGEAGARPRRRSGRKVKRIVVPPSQEDFNPSPPPPPPLPLQLVDEEGDEGRVERAAKTGQQQQHDRRLQLGVAGGALTAVASSAAAAAGQEGGAWMKKRKERPKSPTAALLTTTIDAYYAKTAHNASRGSPGAGAAVLVVGGLPASVWRHVLRFVDGRSLATDVCRVSRIFHRSVLACVCACGGACACAVCVRWMVVC
jgi:hypothetical protein